METGGVCGGGGGGEGNVFCRFLCNLTKAWRGNGG